MKPARAILIACLLWLSAACGAAPPPADASKPAETNVGPLSELLPPGLSLVVLARPRELAAQDSARSLWRAVVAEDRERAFTERTGVDPLAVEELVAVELERSGYVVLARGPFDAVEVVQRAGERIAVPDVHSDEPVVRREGLRGDGRYAYAALDSHAVLAARDADPELIAHILARRGERQTARAFDAADAHALQTDYATSPLAVYKLGPLGLEPGSPIALLFARQRALALSVRPTPTRLDFALDLRGEFPPGAEHNFRTLARSLGQTRLGAALGLASVADSMSIRSDAQGVLITASMDAATLLASLRLLFVAEMRDLLES